ncbi:MAG: type III-A CRISPR-associated RAMP protein Csm3 [Elusimicrobiota bacterium]|nr:type III-A CRISPR-associated RAMP protein Csm3 [Elusimicrobiota bacterium]
MKLNTIKQLTGTICLKTGLHIGSGDVEMHIGGIDSQVVKHPQTLLPYIPGSSLKGKIRSLLELYLGLINFTEGKVFQSKFLKDVPEKDKNTAILLLRLFGDSADNEKDNTIGSTRLSFSDCFVSEKTKDFVLSEVKAEVSIDRKTSEASSGGPRFIERVPQGVQFDFSISIKDFEGDDWEKSKEIILKGLKLLELDSLGGSGSRGYGRVEFKNLKIGNEPISLNEIKI